MKLVFDQNLSRKLVTQLADVFPDSSHVQFHGLDAKLLRIYPNQICQNTIQAAVNLNPINFLCNPL
ncbi:DUF5615 family PIN-like protein [Nostoc sp.]|uniref:DUF5615 family PIN-like protein n=1 Tax=Nostoc sp. TaxID=1180 RepID=UPI002FFCBE0D